MSRPGAGRVRRIGENQVERAVAAEEQGRASDDLDPAAGAEPVGVAADGRLGGGVAFDEGGAARAARQRLEAERAAAREQVGDAQVLERAEATGEHREQRLADPVGGGPSRASGRRLDRPPAPFAGDNAHQFLPTRRDGEGDHAAQSGMVEG